MLILPLRAYGFTQESNPSPMRTPEQEAGMQTQKMQQELDLTPEQTKDIYEINLRHARDRQVSNSRKQALDRVKNKDNEVRRVLTPDQYLRLQDRRYDRKPAEQRPSYQHSLPANAQPTRRNTQVTPKTDARPTQRQSSTTPPARRTTPTTVNPAPNRPSTPPASTRSSQPANSNNNTSRPARR